MFSTELSEEYNCNGASGLQFDVFPFGTGHSCSVWCVGWDSWGEEVIEKGVFKEWDKFLGCLGHCTSETWKDILVKVYARLEMLLDESIVVKMVNIHTLHSIWYTTSRHSPA